MLKNKTAIVTGSTSGIGHAIAITLAKAGCNIMLNGIVEDDVLKNIRNELENFKG